MKKIMHSIMILLMVITICFAYELEDSYGIENNNIQKYSDREMIILEELGDEIENEYINATAISVEKIFSTTLKFKFDTPPIIYENRTLIPVRAVTESLGASVVWYPKEKKVSIKKDSTTIQLYIDNKNVTVNEDEKEIDVPAKIFNNRTYVPLRFVAEEFSLDIQYDPKTGTIAIEN